MRLVVVFCLLTLLGSCGGAAEPAGGAPVDLLVFAPHPDDETLGCSGIIRQALRRRERVKIVIFTNGDGFPAFASLIRHKSIDQLEPEDFRELARFRQSQSQAAFRILGGDPDDLIFLGYPDSGLDQMYRANTGSPVRQSFTGRSGTYGVAQEDYHSAAHGSPAPYLGTSVLDDLSELIRTMLPRRVCVTHEADRHPDHQAAFRFVRDALQRTGYKGEVDTYLIHGGPEWPWPLGMTPEAPYAEHEAKGSRIPGGVPWPPTRRVPLSREDAADKRKAIQVQASHLATVAGGALLEERNYLESFVKSEEVFWRWERR